MQIRREMVIKYKRNLAEEKEEEKIC